MDAETLKIGYLLRYWPTLSETFVAREIGELRRRGARVDVAALGARADAVFAAPEADRALRPPSGARSAELIAPMRALSRSDARAAARTAARHLRPKDVLRALWVADQGAALGWQRIHAHFAGEAAEWAALIAEVLSIPYTVTVHAVDLFVPRPALQATLEGAEAVITVCDHHRRWLREHHGVDAQVVYCGVPLDVPQADPGTEGARLVCVARDVPKKGLDALASAMQFVPDARLRLVSDAHRLGGPRIATGAVPFARIPRLLASSHAFVLPCRIAESGDRDGLPVSILEAMAAGLPVVSTSVAGIPEILDDEVGWLLPPDDHDALVGALREVVADRSERARRGTAARARIAARAWTVQSQVDALLAIWGEGRVSTAV